MSTPTFNGTGLITRAPRDLPGSPELRLRAESLPGVDGQYVQPHGVAARRIVVRGILQATGASAQEAHSDVKSILRGRQDLADGATVATYVGTDGTQYANCVVASVEPTGEATVSSGDDEYHAFLPVEIHILQVTP